MSFFVCGVMTDLTTWRGWRTVGTVFFFLSCLAFSWLFFSFFQFSPQTNIHTRHARAHCTRALFFYVKYMYLYWYRNE